MRLANMLTSKKDTRTLNRDYWNFAADQSGKVSKTVNSSSALLGSRRIYLAAGHPCPCALRERHASEASTNAKRLGDL
jgi:hypothetical protein